MAADAAILASAAAARADLPVTDNLADFQTRDCRTFSTSVARHSDGRLRQLVCHVHRTRGGHRLAVAHPRDVMTRAAQGRSILFADLDGAV